VTVLAPTPRDTIHREGTARLYRFRPANEAGRAPGRAPILLVPSLINRWFVLDLRRGASLAAALVARGFDTYCLDWGVPEDEDRYLTWADVLARLRRAANAVRRSCGATKIGVLGYCIGGTLTGIHAALEPQGIAAFVNLAGPFDFSRGGFLREMVDARWFDPDTIAAAGNLPALQMQSGFLTMRPTAQLSKWVNLIDRGWDPKARESFEALEAWAGDNIPFPGAAYATYIRELYQENQLVEGKHWVAGRRVDLASITCPVLTVVTDRDTICPPAAAEGLNVRCGAKDQEVITVQGGHVGAVIGGKAPAKLYPAISDWLEKRLATSVSLAS
jgi:polyhydroxyalkanoate synthase